MPCCGATFHGPMGGNPPRGYAAASLTLPLFQGDFPDREKKSPVKHWGSKSSELLQRFYSSLFSDFGFLADLALSASALAAAFSAFLTESSLPSSSMIAKSAPSPSR